MKKGMKKILISCLVMLFAFSILSVNAQEIPEDYRLQYHFSQEKGWSNDPNGMVYYKGQWHMFFQYYPDGVNHGPMSWGHAISSDLVNWQEYDIPDVFNASLFPSQDGTRNHFSGCIVWDKDNTSGYFDGVEDGGLVAIWTVAGYPAGIEEGGWQRQAIAYSIDGFNWVEPDLGIERKYVSDSGEVSELSEKQKDYYKNVILAEYNLPRVDGDQLISDDPLNDVDFRDPKVFWHEESQQWMMAVAGGPLRLYSSKDLIHWHAEAMQDDIITECPEIYYLPVENSDEYKYVLSEGGRWYQIGDLQKVNDKWTFVADTGADGTPARYEMNYAPDAYAAQSFQGNEDGRTIMVQWMSNWSYADNTTYPDGTVEAGLAKLLKNHNGQFTLNSQLTLVNTSDGLRMAQKPVEEYNQLKNLNLSYENITIGENNVLSNLKSQQFLMDISIEPEKGTQEVGFNLLKNENYETTVKYNFETQTLTVDRSNSMNAENAPADHLQNGTWFKFLYPYSAKVPMKDGKIELHIYVDNYSIEVYANDYTTVLTELVFPEKDAVNMESYCIGTDVKADIDFATMDSTLQDNMNMRSISQLLNQAYKILNSNTGYTNESLKVLQDSYDDTISLIFSKDVTQEAIDNAKDMLQKAIDSLKTTPMQKPVNNQNNATDSVKTSDNSNLKTFGSLLLITLTGMIVLKKRKID